MKTLLEEKPKAVVLQCDDYYESIVFIRDRLWEDEPRSYEILFQDSSYHNSYLGFWGRLKLAYKTFKRKPVNYTGIYSEDKEKIKNFFEQCLALVNED